MSILIKGLDMPTEGEMLCINIYPDGKVCINLDLECKRIANAVPVPPHGDLIDADALDAYLKSAAIMADGEAKDAYIDARAEAKTMPTIIPAEEGE